MSKYFHAYNVQIPCSSTQSQSVIQTFKFTKGKLKLTYESIGLFQFFKFLFFHRGQLGICSGRSSRLLVTLYSDIEDVPNILQHHMTLSHDSMNTCLEKYLFLVTTNPNLITTETV